MRFTKIITTAVMLSFLMTLTSCQESTSIPQSAESLEGAQSGTGEGDPSSTQSSLLSTTQITDLLNDASPKYDFLAVWDVGRNIEEIEKLARGFGIDVHLNIKRFGAIKISATNKQIAALRASPFIKSIQPDVKLKLHLNTSVGQIKARDVQNLGVDGSGTRVCIIDSGINYHADLPMPEVEYDFVDNDSRAEDVHGHGTSVAGIIASQHKGTLALPSYTGVAPGSTLLVAKVFGEDGKAAASVIASALDWCADNNADVINMSLGHGGYATACDTDYTALFSNTIANLGISVVAASGNDGYTNMISSPACGSKVISVGSVSKSDIHSSFSNAASILDISAPGEYISTTDFKGGYSSFSGTSAATPFVAGVIALLKSMPEDPTHDEIKTALLRGAKDLGLPGKDSQYGNGRVDALAAYNIISGNTDGSTGGTTGSSSGGSSGGSTGGTTGGSSGGTSGGSSGGLVGGYDDGNDEPIELVYSTSRSFSGEDMVSDKYSSSQMSVSKECPAGHYLADMEIQHTIWSFYRSVTWFKLKCQSMSSLDSSLELGKKRHSGSTNVKTNLCTNGRAITGASVIYDRYIKDFKFECGHLSYSKTAEGDVTVSDYRLNSGFTFGYKQRDDKEQKISCPDNTVAVGIEGSAKSDRNEWAFTRLAFKCAELSTRRK